MSWETVNKGPISYYVLAKAEGEFLCTITLEPRPPYCDRGRWIAKLHPVGQLAREIDAADCWPRYYFDLAAAMSECNEWMEFRLKQWKPWKQA